MDLNIISDVITSLGIPIAFCIYMIWKEMKTEAKQQEQLEELRKVVEMNTLTVQRLADKLDALGSDTDVKKSINYVDDTKSHCLAAERR